MRRSLKRLAWIAGALASLLLLVIAAVLIAGNTSGGRVQIEKLVARLTGGNVQLSGLAGSFPSHLTLAELKLEDGDGVWLTAKKIELDWSPWAYLEGRLQIDRLQAASVDMERLPRSSSAPASHGQPSIPRIDVAQASLKLLHLGPALAGVPASLTANGSAHLRSVRDMLFDASARRIDGDGQYDLHLHFDAQRMDAALKTARARPWAPGKYPVAAGPGCARCEAQSERTARRRTPRPYAAGRRTRGACARQLQSGRAVG